MKKFKEWYKNNKKKFHATWISIGVVLSFIGWIIDHREFISQVWHSMFHH